MDERDAIQSVGEILSEFLKSGPQPDDPRKTGDRVLAIVEAAIVNPEESTQRYKERCDDFLERTIKEKGLPKRQVGSVRWDEVTVRSERKQVSKKLKFPRSQLLLQHNACVENYRQQSKLYLEGEMNEFRDMLWRFLQRVPMGGCSDKTAKRGVTEIRNTFRDLTKWERLFSTIKAGSFPAAIRRTYDLNGNPLAAIWRYSPLDEQGEFRNVYSHRHLDGRVYCVRNNWAFEKALMNAGPDGYIDEIVQPGEDFDCMCAYQWIYSLRDLPEPMLTESGRTELRRTRILVGKMLKETQDIGEEIAVERKAESFSSETKLSECELQMLRDATGGGLFRRLIGWFGRGRP